MRLAVLSYGDVTPGNLHSLRRAAASRGLALEEWEPHDVALWCDGPDVRPLYRGEAVVPDVLLHRTVSRLVGVLVPAIRAWERLGTVVPNNPAAAARARDKLATAVELAAAGVPYVPTLGFFPSETAPIDRCGVGRVVVKPARGVQGREVTFHSGPEAAHAEQQRVEWRSGGDFVREHLVAQPMIGGGGQDLRAFVVGGRCLGVVRRRSESPGEHRANLALGGSAAPLGDDHPAAELAVATTAALGLDYAGVDMVEDGHGNPLVLEADAWAGFAGIEETLGTDVAGHILDLSLARATSHS